MTIYIIYARAKAMRNVQNALEIQNMAPRRVLTELVGYVFLMVTVFLILEQILRTFIHFSLLFIINASTMFVVAAFLSIFTVYKIHKRSLRHPSVQKDDFQRLVALVGLVYCVHLLPPVFAHVWFNSGRETETTCLSRENRRTTYVVAIFSGNVNVTVNLFIYLVASPSFRTAFLKFCSLKK